MNKKTRFSLKMALAAAALILLAGAMALVYAVFREQAASGSKSITITVVDSAAKETVYSLKTDAKYLQQAMDEAEGLTYSGAQGPYGLMIDTVNGERADFSLDGAYWGFHVNGQYCNYGISEQPVEDGDAFTIAYTK